MASKPNSVHPKTGHANQTPVAQDAVAAKIGRVHIRKKDFVDRAAERAGGKKTEARGAIDATLALLGELLMAGEELNLPPLGKLKVTRVKDNPKGKVLMVRLVHATDTDATSRNEPLADAAE